jgi:uncharacterized membrane protein YraQ (UPF0718 family)
VISLKSVSNSKVRKWILLGFAALAAIRLYYVREMIAALAIFSVLFALAAGAALMLFLLDRASQRTLAWAELRTTNAAQTARRGWAFAAELSKRPLHRPRSQTAQMHSEKKNERRERVCAVR